MKYKTSIVQLTDSCPLKCEQCYVKSGNNAIKLEDAYRIASYTRKRGGYVMQLTGGEPLLYEGVAEVVGYAAKLGLMTALSTSGFNADKTLLKKLRDRGLTCLSVSLNGSNREINGLSRDGFDYAVKALELAASLGLYRRINWVARSDNYKDFTEVARLASHYGAGGVDVLENTLNRDGKHSGVLSFLELRELADIIRVEGEYARVEECYFMLNLLLDTNSVRDCAAGKDSLFFTAEGRVAGCSRRAGDTTLEELLRVEE